MGVRLSTLRRVEREKGADEEEEHSGGWFHAPDVWSESEGTDDDSRQDHKDIKSYFQSSRSSKNGQAHTEDLSALTEACMPWEMEDFIDEYDTTPLELEENIDFDVF